MMSPIKPLLLILCGCVLQIHAQVVSIDYILGATAKQVAKYTPPKADSVMTLKLDFANSDLTDPAKLDSLRRKPIARIVLVYTSYKQSDDFSQADLNRKRLEELQRKVPYIFNDNLIKWELVEQTGAKTDEQAHDYFHGFVVYFKGRKTGITMTTDEELTSISKVCDECLVSVEDTIYDRTSIYSADTIELDMFVLKDTLVQIEPASGRSFFVRKSTQAWAKQKDPDMDLRPYSISFRHIPDTIVNRTYTLKKKRKKTPGVYVPRSKKKAESGKTYSKPGILGRKQQVLTVMDTTWVVSKLYVRQDTVYKLHARDSTADPVLDKHCLLGQNWSADTVVTKTLLSWTNLSNTVLVEDVTGSMSPYITQTFMWRRATMGATDLSHFVFFNDGDNKSDGSKVIGRTGGIYAAQAHSIDTVENCVETAMRAGSGGDCPENNMEAIIYAMNQFPGYHILMIADNYAPVKDLELLNSSFPPIDIILCGVHGGEIQADYITIARRTGGNIYTLDGSMEAALRAKEGETVKIGDQLFIVKDGRYVLTR